MNLLAHTDALIIDLRKNTGGSPTMIALLSTFLFGPEPVHLNSFYDRSGDKTSQTWTLPYVPGQRTPDKPVFVLTSNRTFSAAEEFTYNLKNLKRATIIGEKTGGGAHPGGDISVTPHFRVFVPVGRAINPISGTNWEGTGIEPDIAVPEAGALDYAYRLALGEVIKRLGDATVGAAKTQIAEARSALAALEA
jgi:C-terminal processing protease CtpA/Prc